LARLLRLRGSIRSSGGRADRGRLGRRSGRSIGSTGSTSSVSGGRLWRERDVLAALAGLAERRRGSATSAAAARSARAVAVLRLRRGLSVADIVVVMAAATLPSTPALASCFAARRETVPMYHRAPPIRTTAAEVKNISGNRSISG
jgi:hypothetical protein